MENIIYFAPTGGRDLSQAAHLLLERALGYAPDLSFGAHGKPYLAGREDLYFSLSHTQGAAVCALSARPCGVDLEGPRRINTALAARYFTAAEAAFARTPQRFLIVWTRKEALLKRDGLGITVPLKQMEALLTKEVVTRMVQGYTLSFCGDPTGFSLKIVRL